MAGLSLRGRAAGGIARRAVVLAPLALGGCVAALLVLGAISVVLSLRTGEPTRTIVDFDVFHLVGRLVREGRLGEAYSWSTMEALEDGLGRSGKGYLPYAYPPPFAIAMAALATLPVGAAYAVFTAAGSALFAVALWRLSPHWFWPTILALSPPLLVDVMSGQNGMLTGGLAGLSAGLALGRPGGAAGALAGLLAALKPQLAVGFPLLFATRRDWRAAIIMAATAAALCGAAAAALGPAILPAFLAGLSETAQALSQSRFPLHRMASVYACLRSLGVPAGLALPLHAASALVALGAVAAVGRRVADARAASGLALIATAFVSPYFYDYDMPVVGIGLALALPALARTMAPQSICGLLAAVALAGSIGGVQAVALSTKLSLGAPILAACLGVILAKLPRQPMPSPGWRPGEARGAA